MYTENSSWERTYTTEDISNESKSGNLYENIRIISWLTDTSEDGEWSKYKTDYANWAIGGPTIEMFVKSYNAMHENKIELKVQESAYGYEIKLQDSNEKTKFNTYIGNLSIIQSADASIYANSGYWWLASPSANYSDSLIVSFNNGNINSGSNANKFGIRPIVSVPLSKIEDGTIKITDEYLNSFGVDAQK